MERDSEMSADQTNVIDLVSTDRMSGTVVLTISDHLDWSDSRAHQKLLQDTLNRYLAFVESGEILESYPDAKESHVAFAVVFQFPPDEDGRCFLDKVKKIVESAGFNLREEIFAAARFN